MTHKVVFVDIDDTLVRSAGTKRIPMHAVISSVRRLKEEGADLYMWSTGGADYAKSTAIELGLEDCFTAFLPKPQIYLDDQPVDEWRNCKHLYPLQADNA